MSGSPNMATACALLRGGPVPEVRAYPRCLTARRPQLTHRVIQRRRVARHDEDTRPGQGQRSRDPAADTRTAPGDQRHQAFK